MKQKNIVKLTLVMLIWGSSWILLKFTLGEVPPISLAFLRFFIASPTIFLLALITKKRSQMKIRLEEIPTYSILALTGVTLLYVAEFFGLKYTTTINASILVNLSIIFIALFAFFFLKEKLGKREWSGIIISFIGVFFIISRGNFFNFMQKETFWGDTLFILSAFFG